MENASKALIIAGAILLSIAIIGIGMYIYTTAQQTIQSANMSQQEITAYNSTFVKYEGTQSGSNVKALLQTVRSHNAANADDTSKQIIVKSTSSSTETTVPTKEDKSAGSNDTVITSASNDILAGYRYKVSFGYSKNGLINSILINNLTNNTK